VSKEASVDVEGAEELVEGSRDMTGADGRLFDSEDDRYDGGLEEEEEKSPPSSRMEKRRRKDDFVDEVGDTGRTLSWGSSSIGNSRDGWVSAWEMIGMDERWTGKLWRDISDWKADEIRACSDSTEEILCVLFGELNSCEILEELRRERVGARGRRCSDESRGGSSSLSLWDPPSPSKDQTSCAGGLRLEPLATFLIDWKALEAAVRNPVDLLDVWSFPSNFP